MGDEANKQTDELAALKKKVEALEAAQPKPVQSAAERERADAEWRDQMHQMRERRMSMAMPPSVVRDLNVLDDNLLRGVRGDARAPTGRPGMIPDSQQPASPRPSAGDGTGWAREIPLGPQPGIDLIDRGVNAALPHGPEWGKEKKE
jgi:hypothetical protein